MQNPRSGDYRNNNRGTVVSVSSRPERAPVPFKLSYMDNQDKIVNIKKTDAETGITVSSDFRLAILKPTKTDIPSKTDVQIVSYIVSPNLIAPYLNLFEGVISVDIETRGTQAADKNCIIVGIGMADANSIVYFDFATNSTESNKKVLDFLASYTEGLIGYNVFFDGTFLMRETDKWLNWSADVYGMYKQLASEGYGGQKWGLKNAQLELLNWETKGDTELDQWLIKNGYYTSVAKSLKQGYSALAEEKEDSEDTDNSEILSEFASIVQKSEDTEGERYFKPNKSEMWRAPAEILGYYCGLDAASCYQLYVNVILPSIKGQTWAEQFQYYHQQVFMLNVKLLGEQQLSGITIDRDRLNQYNNKLQFEINNSGYEFLNHPTVRPFADLINKENIEELKAKEPVKFKKQPVIKSAPPKYKKDGTISASWTKYTERKNLILSKGSELTAHWIKWEEKLKLAETAEHFNPNSNAQLARLFYDFLGFPVLVRTAGLEPRKLDYSGAITSQWIEWHESAPATGSKALPGFGEIGKLLKANKDKVKEQTFVQALLDKLILGADGIYRLHPQFRVPGTLTSRLAGSGGFNVQAVPKSRGFLECWRPMVPGKVWIDFDVNSLEQVVMAELSGDNSLFKIYGPNAKDNQDVYLFNGSQLPVIGPKILAAGYNPDFPPATAEELTEIKKQVKKERGIAKVITLSSSYGAGAQKIQMTLALDGIKLTNEEAKQLHAGYWEIYSGVKLYEKQLLKEWDRNNGYVINGMGRPVGCAREYLKDIINRVCQSTGHDILMLYIKICNDLFVKNNIKVNGIMWDFHDESILECNVEDSQKVIDIMGREAFKVLNEEYMRGMIPLKGEGGIIDTMADAKCPV